MERQSYYQPSESGNKESGKDKKSSGGFNVAPNPAFPSVEHAEPVRQPERRIPIAPAFEGVISWREQADEMIRHSEERHRQQEAKDNAEVRVEGEQSKDKDDKEETSSKKGQASQQQPIPFRPPQEVATPRPLSEVIAEESEASKDGQADEELPAPTEYQPQPIPFRTAEFSQDTLTQREENDQPLPGNGPAFDAFPPLADRAPDVPQTHQEALVPTPAEFEQPPTPLQPGEYQAYIAAESENSANAAEEDPNQPQYVYASPQAPAPQPAFNQAPPVGQGFNPNANPFMPAANGQPNLPPANPNVSPLGGNGNVGGNGGNLPPNQPGYGFNNSPYNPNSPYHPAFTGGGVAANQAPAPVMPIERPGLPQTNRDPRVGGVAALLGLEYFARKRADRKLEKRVNQRSDERLKKHEQQMAMDHRRMQEQQKEFAAEQQRQTRDLNRMRYQEDAPQSVTDALRSTSNLPKPFESTPTMFGATEQGQARPMRPEARQQQTPAAEAAVQQAAQEAEEQAIQVGPHEHVAHSAWHNIVVDEKGREVVGAIQYGEGFQRERQQEAMRDNFAMSDGGQAGAGSSSQVTGGGFAQDQFGSPMLPSGMTNPTLPQGHSTHVDPQHQLPATNKQQNNITSPWFWIMLILIIAAFFTAALV